MDETTLSVKLMTFRALPSMFGFFADHHAELHNPGDRKLSDSLSPKTDKLLRAHYGGGYSEKQSLTPLGLLFTHEFMDDSGPDQGGVDDYFNLVAHRDHKKTRSLDDHSVVGAIKPVLELTLEESRQEIAAKGADAAVKETILLNDPADSDWRYGKVGKSTHAALARMKKDHPETYQMLLPRRNRQWMPAITRALEGDHKTAIFVGALHLPGPDGLLTLLRQQGYHPQQMYGIDHPKPAARAR